MTDAVQRRSRQSWEFLQPVWVLGSAGVVGPKEGEGPLGKEFDYIFPELRLEEKSFERAEQKMQQKAVDLALAKSGLLPADIDLLLGGDLINQITPSCFTARGLGVPFCGTFTACATAAEALSLAALAVASGAALHSMAMASSHTCTAERQFRYPNEYGAQKPPYSQQTATAAGAVVLGRQESGVRVRGVTIGRVLDEKISDPFQLNAAMAPAFADTLTAHLFAFGRTPMDYDLILSGDLGRYGMALAQDLLARQGVTLPEERFFDCGLLLYGNTDSVFSGGSGCGCSASVGFGPILHRLQEGKYRRVLLIATGALLSPLSNQQGETIPGIAHCVEWEGGYAHA